MGVTRFVDIPNLRLVARTLHREPVLKVFVNHVKCLGVSTSAQLISQGQSRILDLCDDGLVGHVATKDRDHHCTDHT